MTSKHRILSLLLAISILVSMMAVLGVSAAGPVSLEISKVVDFADDVALTIGNAIKAASQDVDGVYFNVNYPTTLTYANVGDFPTQDYIVMMASAIVALNGGKADTTVIAHKAITLDTDAVKNGKATSLNKAQYVELADRVARYGTTMGSLPSSFNRPTDGTNVYDGRMTVYSIGHLFATVLASYATAKALPATATFLPVHYGNVQVTLPAPKEPADWYKAVIAASVKVKTEMDGNKLSGTILVDPLTVTPAQYLYLACKVTVGLSGGKTSEKLSIKKYDEAPSSQGTGLGQVYEDDYVDMANRIITFMDTNGAAPNYATSSSIGQVSYYKLIQMYAKILNFYNSNGATPNYCTVVDWTGTVGTVPTATEPAATVVTTAATTAATTASTTAGNVEVAGTQTYAEIVAASVTLADAIEANKKMSSSIKIGTKNYGPAQYMYLASKALIAINGGTTSGSASVVALAEPSNTSETLSPDNIYLTEYVKLANNMITWLDNNAVGPAYVSTSLGNMDYKMAIYMLAKILRYYKNNSALPNYCSVTLWTILDGTYVSTGDAVFGNDFSSYSSYLVPTANCQSTNATIKAAAKTAMKYTGGSGCATPTTTYQAMWNLEKYVNPKLTYDSYYDTSRGALGTWNAKMGNCCDMAHLAVAMARSLGVPARYQHGYCKFQSGLQTGHVWAQVYCGSSKGWKIIDWVSGSNYLGYKNNTTITLYNTYAALPF